MGPYQKYLHKCDNESDVDLGGHVKRGFSNSAEFQQISKMIVRLFKMQTRDCVLINMKLLKSGSKATASNTSPWQTFSK